MGAANAIEIEGLVFPGFGPMYVLHGKLVFPVFPSSDVTRALKFFQLKSSIF